MSAPAGAPGARAAADRAEPPRDALTSLKALWLVLATAVSLSPRQSALCLSETLGRACMAFVPLLVGVLVGAAVGHDLRRTVLALALLVGATALNIVLVTIGTSARVAQMELVGSAFDERIARVLSTIPTLDHLQDSRFLDETQILHEGKGVLGGAFNMLLNSLNSLVFATVTLVVATQVDWRLVLLVLAGVPRLASAQWSMRWGKAAEDAGAAAGRMTDRLCSLSTTAAAGAEVRVFGLRDTLLTLIRDSARSWRRPGLRLATRNAVLTLTTSLVFFAAAVLVLGLLTRDVLAGRAPVVALVVAVGVIGNLEMLSGVLASATAFAGRTLRIARRYLWLQDFGASAARAAGSDTAPTTLTREILFDKVSYVYGGSSSPALTEVSVALRAGSIVAIVGENGSGKSTFVTLLAGLHRPTSGRVLIDGRDLASLSPEEWRRQVSGSFQDHASFELSLQHAVGVGDLPAADDAGRTTRAMTRAAAGELVEALPDGLQTQLGSTWLGGVDLSGGQAQKVSLARGTMRLRPLVLVLDEPTAALDAVTERSLFDSYLTSARERRSDGSIVVMVTHRYSNVAAADLIVVLDEGRVAETGTHLELLGRGGVYSRLYSAQADGYR